MDRIVYFKTPSPYPNDFTKNCSLTGIEIDNNFLTLEGRDVKSMKIEGNYLIVTLYNGSILKGEITGLFAGYTAGKGIDANKLEYDKVIETHAGLVETVNDIPVSGAQIGSYYPGDVIPSGTTVEEILKKILAKVCDVKAVLPTSQIVVNANKQYEVGTITNFYLYTTYNQGGYKGLDEYSYYSLISGCEPLKAHYFLNETEIGQADIDDRYVYSFGTSRSMEEGEYKFGSVVYYGASPNTPKKSDGSDSTVTIDAGITQMATKTITAAYKYYYGYIPLHPYAWYYDIIPNQTVLNSMNLQSGFCTKDGLTVIPEMESSTEKSSLILVLPEKYKNIIYTENVLHEPINVNERWLRQKHFNPQTGTYEDLQFTYTNGNASTTYYVYIMHSLLPVNYYSITFGED